MGVLLVEQTSLLCFSGLYFRCETERGEQVVSPLENTDPVSTGFWGVSPKRSGGGELKHRSAGRRRLASSFEHAGDILVTWGRGTGDSLIRSDGLLTEYP